MITYRARSSVRDMAKALGFAPGQQDAWSKQVDAWGNLASTADQPDVSIPATVMSGVTPVVPPVRMQDAIKSTDVKKEKVG